MTVCIAVECKMIDGSRGFVVCADTELSGNVVDPAADKLYQLGNNFLAMMSGPWPSVLKLAKRLQGEVASYPPESEEALKTIALKVSSSFASSVMTVKDSPCELLITGFVGTEPVMLHVWVQGEESGVEFHTYRCAIGGGRELANAILSERGYTPIVSLEQALYIVYEAKRFSEWCDGVGKKTQILLHVQMREAVVASAELTGEYLSDEAIERLESLRAEFFVRPLGEIERFPLRFFEGRYPFAR